MLTIFVYIGTQETIMQWKNTKGNYILGQIIRYSTSSQLHAKGSRGDNQR